MATCRTRLKGLLDEAGIPYRDVPHAERYTSQRTAEETHTPGRSFAKTVVVRLDGRFALVVLPAHRRLDLEKLKSALGARDAAIATEEEMKDLFPDAELGAEPPLGALYGLPVFASRALSAQESITFNAGTHRDAIRLRYSDFESLANPIELDVTR